MLSGRGSDTSNRGTPSCFTKSEALGNKEALEVEDFSITTERVLLVEAVLRDEELIGEAGDPPGALTVGEYTGLQLSGHR